MDTIVTLGAHEIPVVAQKHARLTRRAGQVITTLQTLGVELDDMGDLDKVVGDIAGTASGVAYDVLCALIPAVEKRIPRYEFNGYASQEAADMDEYEEDKDESPSVPQIVHAIKTAIDVNGLTFLGKIGSLLESESK